MDKVLHKAPVGLCAAWLAAGCDRKVTKELHESMKADLMSEEGMGDRALARCYFQDEAVLDALKAEVLQKEEEVAGCSDEPVKIEP